MPIELTVEDMQKLTKTLDDYYVRKSHCEETQKKINSRFANDDKRIELLIQQQRVNNWLTTAIAAGIIALLIKVFLGG